MANLFTPNIHYLPALSSCWSKNGSCKNLIMSFLPHSECYLSSKQRWTEKQHLFKLETKNLASDIFRIILLFRKNPEREKGPNLKNARKHYFLKKRILRHVLETEIADPQQCPRRHSPKKGTIAKKDTTSPKRVAKLYHHFALQDWVSKPDPSACVGINL